MQRIPDCLSIFIALSKAVDLALDLIRMCDNNTKETYMVWEINIGVCPRLESDNIMFITCLGYDFYIYDAFKFFMQFHC